MLEKLSIYNILNQKRMSLYLHFNSTCATSSIFLRGTSQNSYPLLKSQNHMLSLYLRSGVQILKTTKIY